MEKQKIIFLRHADTKKDPSLNAALWELSGDGKKQALEISKNPEMLNVDAVYVSEERKTLLTAGPILEKISKQAQALALFNEVRRGDKFLPKEEFEVEKNRQLADLSYRAFDGESGIEALKRFEEGIMQVSAINKGKVILVVTHGTILNIYFASLLNLQGKLLERWNKTGFCAYGITENGKVIKDIV